jgi:hypothetical protein
VLGPLLPTHPAMLIAREWLLSRCDAGHGPESQHGLMQRPEGAMVRLVFIIKESARSRQFDATVVGCGQSSEVQIGHSSASAAHA